MSEDRRKARIGDSALGYTQGESPVNAVFINPYPWMSSVEARVHLALEARHVPFTWRFFDGDNSPHVQELMPAYAPEFTLKEYRTVIIVQGGYFNTIPGVLDTVALAQVLLEADGWTVVVLYEQDIYGDLMGTLEKRLPWFAHPSITGPPRTPPTGSPDFMSQRRHDLAAWALHRAKYALTRQQETSRGRSDVAGRERRRPRRVRSGRTGNRERSG